MRLSLFALHTALGLLRLFLARLEIVKTFHYFANVVIFPVFQSLDQVDDFSIRLVSLRLLHQLFFLYGEINPLEKTADVDRCLLAAFFAYSCHDSTSLGLC